MKTKARTVLVLSALAVAAAAYANETTVYRYDGRGRLIRVERTGTVNNNANTNYSYDKGDNRTNVAMGIGLAGPPPPPANQPPVAAPNSLSLVRCSTSVIDVVANDTDFENNVPLTLLSVSAATMGTATVTSSTQITYQAAGSTGSEVLTYTIQDGLGATATGTLTVTIVSGQCGG